jgi:uncharacterized protein YukE
MDEMYVDVTGVHDAVPSFDALADRIAEAYRRLGSVLDGEGACWGGDEVGARFAQAYQPAAERVRGAFPDLSESVHEVASALRTVAADVAASDQRAVSRLG